MVDYRNVANFDLEMGAIVGYDEGTDAEFEFKSGPYKSITIANDGTSDVTLAAAGEHLSFTGGPITVKASEVFTGAFRGGVTTFTITNAGGSSVRIIVRK